VFDTYCEFRRCQHQQNLDRIDDIVRAQVLQLITDLRCGRAWPYFPFLFFRGGVVQLALSVFPRSSAGAEVRYLWKEHE